MTAMNAATSHPLNLDLLAKVITKWWPDLESDVEQRTASLPERDGKPQLRDQREMLEEIVPTVREIACTQQPVEFSTRQRAVLRRLEITNPSSPNVLEFIKSAEEALDLGQARFFASEGKVNLILETFPAFTILQQLEQLANAAGVLLAVHPLDGSDVILLGGGLLTFGGKSEPAASSEQPMS
jgi:hypothetical protein